jgi:hypothetical protein
MSLSLGCSFAKVKGPSGEPAGPNHVEKKQEGPDQVLSESDAIRLAESCLREKRALYAKYRVNAIKEDNDEWRVVITAIPETPGKRKTVIVKKSGSITIEPGE